MKNKWNLFLLFNLLIWTITPLLRISLPMDTQEAIVWGKFCLWGTTKHPPFSGWVAYYFYELLGENDFSMYLLSQIFVALGLVYIYKLARLFLNETKAVLASMLQLGVIYYDYSSVEFNVNLISLALWPMCAYYFWLAINNNKWKDWLILGALVALNGLNKYVSAWLVVALGLFVLSKISMFGIKSSRLYKAICATLFGLLLIAPHLYWLYDNDFVMFEYITERSQNSKGMGWLGHFIFPLKFIGAQILFSAAAWISYTVFYLKSKKEKNELSADAKRFILLLTFVPISMFVLISFVGGSALKSMWGFPMLFMTGIFLMTFFPIKISEKTANKMFVTMACWSMAFVIAYATQCLLTKSERFRTDCPKLAGELQEKWNEYTNNKPLEYVAGEVWYSNIMTLYGNDNIKPMIWMKPKANPWFDEADFEQKGALVLARGLDEYEKYERMADGKLSKPQKMSLTFYSRFGKKKVRELYYGFYNVEETVNGK